MILCFGRHLLEFVPQLRGTITGYTHRVMDNSWDLILTSRGWVGFVVNVCVRVCVYVCVCVYDMYVRVCWEGVNQEQRKRALHGGTPRILHVD